MAAVLQSRSIIQDMARTPDITVAAVTETDGRFLVVEERINRRLVFNQPAGHVEHGETLLAAVVREVREETAWGFEPKALIGVYLWCNPASGRSTMRFAFTGTVMDHHASQPLDRGIVCTHWLSRQELMEREDPAPQPARAEVRGRLPGWPAGTAGRGGEARPAHGDDHGGRNRLARPQPHSSMRSQLRPSSGLRADDRTPD